MCGGAKCEVLGPVEWRSRAKSTEDRLTGVWQSKQVLRSIEVVKQQKLSRENATVRWKA